MAVKEALKRDMAGSAQTPEALADRLFAIQTQDHRYAETTGDSYYFVRTLSNLGGRLPSDAMHRFGVMIEKALAWEPMNPYCWMLWADWLERQGNGDQREWVLREMLRLFPDDEPSRVVLAGLLVRCQRVPDAVILLNAVLDRNPNNLIARQFLDRLQPGATDPWDGLDDLHGVDADEAEANDAMEPGSPASQPSEGDAPQISGLAEVIRRGRLAAELSRARIAAERNSVTETGMIESEGRCGDALAGLYLQWLRPDTAPEPPPHAWAWRACRPWQTEAAADDWAGLEQEIPERRMQTGFLRQLASIDPEEFERESRRWLKRYPGDDGNDANPAGAFMRGQLPSLLELTADERRDTALAVLASGTVGTSEFAA